MSTSSTPTIAPAKSDESDYSKLDILPSTYQAVHDLLTQKEKVAPFGLRRETFARIEKLTGRPLVSFVTKTRNIGAGVPASIDDGDLIGFSDLVTNAPGDEVDVLITSNGESAEASERIVRLLRSKFKTIRFIVPSNAYSAATLICLSGDSILMGPIGTLGPIDPQINGVPARAILRAFENLEARLGKEGPKALTAYMPLIAKYDLHILEICKSAQELSEELARAWLSTYMLKCKADDSAVTELVDFFKSYDVHKSHGRSIDRDRAREKGLKTIEDAESTKGLGDLLQSLVSQYDFWFDKTPFYKMYEDARGINWGRQIQQQITMPFPIQLPVAPQPPPKA